MQLTHWCLRLTNSEMVKALNGSEEQKKALKEYLLDKVANNIPFVDAEFAIYLALIGEK